MHDTPFHAAVRRLREKLQGPTEPAVYKGPLAIGQIKERHTEVEVPVERDLPECQSPIKF